MSSHSPSPRWTPALSDSVQDISQLLAWYPYHLSNRDHYLEAALALHGLNRSDEYPYEYWQMALVAHVFNGFCFAGSGPTCALFHHYPSNSLLCADICKYVVTAQPPFNFDGLVFLSSTLGFSNTTGRSARSRDAIHAMLSALAVSVLLPLEHPPLAFLFNCDAPRSRLELLHSWLRHHGVPAAGTRDQLYYSLFHHIASGACLVSHPGYDGCRAVRDESSAACSPSPNDPNRHLLYLADVCMRSQSPATVSLFLRVYNVVIPAHASELADMLPLVDSLRPPLRKAIARPLIADSAARMQARGQRLQYVRSLWPQVPSQGLKDSSVSHFRAATSSDALRCRPCASCGASVPYDSTSTFDASDIDLRLFLPTGRRRNAPVPFPMPFSGHAILANAVLEPTGVTTRPDGSVVLNVCSSCKASICAGRVPRLALANGLYVGSVPEVLQNLSVIEETLIARARAKCVVVQLQLDANSPARSPANQRALKGNVVIFPQHPEPLPFLLPPSVEDILEYVCVVFIGAAIPEPEWFEQHARPLVVRPARVRKALEWLKIHNKLYENVRINEEALNDIPESGLLPYHVELVNPSKHQESMTSNYVPEDGPPLDAAPRSVPFPSLVVANLGRDVSSSELRAAAIKHIKENKGAFIAVPHDPFFVNEFSNPHLFPSLYPTLFPYGVGGVEDAARAQRVSFENHVKHLLSLHDRRFQEHPSFLFTAFNIVQRRTMLRSVHLHSQRSWFNEVAGELASVSSDSIHSVATFLKYARDGVSFFQPSTEEEKLVQKLLYQVNYVSRGIPGTNSSRLAMRNEIRALVVSLGVPQLFITLNPSDVRNPIVKFLAGADIDIDNMPDADVPEYWEQSCLVAQNPFVAAKFFNLYVKAFIAEILRWDVPSFDDFSDSSRSRIGLFGATRAFYGAVEAQGRGTLHVHMVVFCEGGLNPNELKARLLGNPEFASRFTAFAEDAITTSLPTDPGPDIIVQSDRVHPCSVRGPEIRESIAPVVYEKDLRNVAEKVQVHEHKLTCFKYCSPPPAPQTCRFDLDPSLHIPESRIDPENGEFTLRHLDGMVNNFNDTILRALRNNMDIKIIGSGESAKAIVFYITDYITKSQLKIHVAFSALEQALRKLENSSETLDETAQKGKRILQKCAYEMLGRQEMSAPQVASVLMDYEDHFTSHSFRCLFWTSAENYVAKHFDPEALPDSRGTDHVASAITPLPPSIQSLLEGVLSDNDGDWSSVASDDGSQHEDDRRDVLALDDDVIWAQDEDGAIAPHASQLRDYLYRGTMLDRVSFWDFVARVSKVRASKSGRDALTMLSVDESETLFEDTDALTCATPDRPVCRLLKAHDEHSSSYLTVCHPIQPFIPVLIGPAIPRRDRPEVFEKYCRLMLIFFKPWRSPTDLRRMNETWEQAFLRFRSSPECTVDVVEKLDNMQVFHECKDSRDEHYRKRHAGGPGLSSELTDRDDVNALIEDLSGIPEGDGDGRQFALMLKKLNATFSKRENMASERVQKVLEAAANAGRFASSNMHGFEEELSQITSQSTSAHVDVSSTGMTLEAVWKKAYHDRSTQWKYGLDGVDDPDDDDPTLGGPRVPFQPSRTPHLPTVIDLGGISLSAKKTLRDDNAKSWTLNAEQEYAYRIMTDQVISPGDGPLKMLVTGPAGTGKTRVVDAVKDFFGKLGQDHRYILASFTQESAVVMHQER